MGGRWNHGVSLLCHKDTAIGAQSPIVGDSGQNGSSYLGHYLPIAEWRLNKKERTNNILINSLMSLHIGSHLIVST